MPVSYSNGQNTHNVLPSPQEWARLLGGKVMPNGRTVRYPRPGRKHDDGSLTLTVGHEFPGGYSVADPEGTHSLAGAEGPLRADGRAASLRANESNSSRRGNGARHRPADGSIVPEAMLAGVADGGEEEASASPLPISCGRCG